MATTSDNTMKIEASADHSSLLKMRAPVQKAMGPVTRGAAPVAPLAESLLPGLSTEAGADNDDETNESGMGEEQVLIAESTTEAAGEGLFGGMAAGGVVGAPIAGVVGLAAVGATGNTAEIDSSSIRMGRESVIQVARADSEGINIGPSEDGTVLVSGGKTDVTLIGGDGANASIKNLSILNPNAPLPSGVPIEVDPANQSIKLDLGPLARADVDLTLDTLQAAVGGLIGDLSSGNLELEQLVALDIPTSLAGMDIPVTDTLNQVLTQLDDALTPLTEGIQSAATGVGGNETPLTQLQDALVGAPVLGDALSAIQDGLGGGLPTGPLPLPQIDPSSLPQTGTPVDLVTGTVTSNISSLAMGDLQVVDILNGLVPV